MIIRNHKELLDAYQTSVFDSFFITPQAMFIVSESLERNIKLLEEAYGSGGSGGYIRIISHSLSTEEGINEYLAELSKYNLEPDMWEFDDLLVKSETEQIHLQLFAMTEFNLLLLYVKKGGVCD